MQLPAASDLIVETKIGIVCIEGFPNYIEACSCLPSLVIKPLNLFLRSMQNWWRLRRDAITLFRTHYGDIRQLHGGHLVS